MPIQALIGEPHHRPYFEFLAAAKVGVIHDINTYPLEFSVPDFAAVKAMLKAPVIFDGRNIYEPKDVRAAGLEYFAIGRP